ncbi:DUF1289 domain-containing protein [Marinomonas sp.]|nr:DUF1289 domain-containing protein [Marinomonas sp.]MDB4837681.1 DUF1289 domain-containing protein [Marinomonas sp.]
MKNTSSNKIESPCIRNCCLDEEDVCVGCLRTLDDILRWQSTSSEEKLEVLARSKKRRMSKQML